MTCCGTKTETRNKFRPDYNFKALTEKFYARHDQVILNPEVVHKYELEIEKRINSDLHAIFPVPVTENQVYGWLEEKQIRYKDAYDRELLLRPKKVDDDLKIMQKIVSTLNKNKAAAVRK